MTKKKIAVFTATRAEYGLLYWLMKDLQASKELTLQLIVSGMHLSPEFGDTWKVIEDEGFPIDAKVEMLLSSDTPIGIAKSMGLGIIGYADAFDRLRPDALIVLGDRFEALAVVQTALVMKIPVIHLHGGEITEGAYDNSIRHAISKIANLHFVSTDEYRTRLIQMGELPESVINLGAIGLDNLTRDLPQLSRKELMATLAPLPMEAPYFLVTYHPVTLGNEDPSHAFQQVLNALDLYPSYSVIFTYPNADNGGRVIIKMLEDYISKNPNRAIAVKSLGSVRYLAALRWATAVIGNSSSGIIEAPSFKVPTINIGVRQQGRVSGKSVMHCKAVGSAIAASIDLVTSEQFRKGYMSEQNPYGSGGASTKIVEYIETNPISLIKHFYDLKIKR